MPRNQLIGFYKNLTKSGGSLPTCCHCGADLLLKLLHQNTGTLAARKREEFSELSHAELESIEQRYQEAFSRP